MRPPALLCLLALLTACGNDPPTEPGLSLAPAEPTTTDDLVLSLDEASDPDGDPVEHTLAWTVDGSPVDVDGTTVSADRTAKGQVWQASVTASDGEHQVGPITAQVTILNTPPTLSSVEITPAEPRTSDALTCTAGSTSDADDDVVEVELAWTVDGVAAAVGDTLQASAFEKGQVVECTGTPSDGEVDGEPATAQVIVQNTPPGPPVAGIRPEAPVAGVDDLVCEVQAEAADDDGDTLTYVVSWTADGVVYPDGLVGAEGPLTTTWADDTVPAVDTLLATEWSCLIQAEDGEARSTAAEATVHVAPPCSDLVVGALPGWGDGYEDSSLTWSSMLASQDSYGDCGLSMVDIPPGFTLTTLLDAGVDVVLIPNVGGGSTTYSASEQDAITSFVDEGHGGVVATYLMVFETNGWRDGAELLGVAPGTLVAEGESVGTRIDVHHPGHELMSGLEVRSFEAGGYAQAQRLNTSLDKALLADTTVVANTGAAAVIAHDGDHRGVWITWMVEYDSTTADGEQLMYNSLVWAAGHAP